MNELEKNEHSTPDGDSWSLSANQDGTFHAQSLSGRSEDSKPNRTLNQFCGDLNKKYPQNQIQGVQDRISEMVPTTPKQKSSGDWETDQLNGYVCHVIRPQTHKAVKDKLIELKEPIPASFDGPDDAFVWLGQPDE